MSWISKIGKVFGISEVRVKKSKKPQAEKREHISRAAAEKRERIKRGERGLRLASAPVSSPAPAPTSAPTPTSAPASSDGSLLAAAPTPSSDLTNSPPILGDKRTCDKSLQSLVDAASSGDTVEAPGGCVYRETVTINKPLTLKAARGAEIRGSDVWTGWTKSGSYWMKGTLPSFSAHGECKSGTSRCLWPEQVFFDGKPLLQVASNPASGQFAVDSNRNVMLADDPTGHSIEVTTRTQWILGKSENVTIEGFMMKHAANDSQTGALINRPGPTQGPAYSNWTIQDNVLSDTHGTALFLVNTGQSILRNDISYAGQLGFGGGGTNALVQDNRLHHNNTEDFDPEWEAGGMKLASSAMDARIIGNHVYNNDGVGLWCDVGCNGVTILGNRVSHNKKIGIQYEISQNAKISYNVVWENGWGRFDSNQGSGIMVSNSKDVEVYNNTVAWNADGIGVLRVTRGDAYDDVSNVNIHDNTILAKDYSSDLKDNYSLSWIGSNSQLFDPASNNRAANNRYWYPASESSLVRFAWNMKGYSKLSDFNTTAGEENGRYLTSVEKDQVVFSEEIPASPQTR